jgi:DNA polymerase delta subunit 2
MLEDESGRVQLVGERVNKLVLVTGVIMAALGRETSTGEFEVFDVCFAGLPPQMTVANGDTMDVDGKPYTDQLRVSID